MRLASGSVAELLLACAFMLQVSTALAQEKVSIGRAFDPELADLTLGAGPRLMDAANKANSAGCAKLTVRHTVFRVADPKFATLVASKRESELRRVLVQSGLAPDRIEFVRQEGGKQQDGNVEVEFRRLPDVETPTLKINSVPAKGTRVKPGSRIEVTMEARDDSNNWQTGVQRIQLLAESEGNSSVSVGEWKPEPRKCDRVPAPRSLKATYTVPKDPPPIVRLRAITEDFAGNHDTKLGEFPTGDWHGKLQSEHSRGGLVELGKVDIAVSLDGPRKLTGSFRGERTVAFGIRKDCTWNSEAPARLWGRLKGTYSPGGTMSLEIAEFQSTSGHVTGKCGKAPINYQMPGGGADGIYFMNDRVLADLTLTPEKGFQKRYELPGTVVNVTLTRAAASK